MSNLANKLRPQSINEIIGQNHIKPFLQKIIAKKEKFSFLLYGKPGTGKTSLAYVLCQELKVNFTYFNAATGNKKQLVNLIKINDYLIIDEIHRLNKDKQDILLPAIEFDKIKIIATTTENPYFVVNPSIRSRVHILELKEISEKEIAKTINKVIRKEHMTITISPLLIKTISQKANGDYRFALNILEILEKLFPKQKITKKIISSVMPSIHFFSDKNGDGHYNLLSAFHKSLRGSDIDASLYYLAQLIESGDMLGMERRMIMVAYEDVGLANPNVALRVSTAIENAKKIGFPEARIILANAIIDICKAKKSNSAYLAIDKAQKMIYQSTYPIPYHLQDSHYKSAKKINRGVGYKYPHDYGGYVKQQYLPTQIQDQKIYQKNKNDKL